jgi:serine/threonine protein phosphatase PrpC
MGRNVEVEAASYRPIASKHKPSNQIRMRIRVASRTDKGRVRKNNEDSLLVRPSVMDAGVKEGKEAIDVCPEGAVFAVADGMGGHLAGEVASMLAIEAIEEMLDMGVFQSGITEKEIWGLLDLVFMNAHTSLIERGKEDPRTEGMGTTLVMGLIREMTLYVAWLGDSRCYLYRKGSGLDCITKDHTCVQMLVEARRITMYQAFDHPGSNIITRSLICVDGDDSRPDQATVKLEKGDRLLFCSDGLNGMLRDWEIEAIFADGKDGRDCVGRLIASVNDKGGKDNVTVVLVDVLSDQFIE